LKEFIRNGTWYIHPELQQAYPTLRQLVSQVIIRIEQKDDQLRMLQPLVYYLLRMLTYLKL
jgi:DNA-binding PadR family transcriptional regulator